MHHIHSRLQDVSYDAYEALDEFHYHLLREMRNNIEAQTSVMKRLKSAFSGSYSNDPRQILGRKIKDINEKVDSLIFYGGENSVGIHQRIIIGHGNDPGLRSSSRETDSFALDPVFIGRENDVSELVEMLVNIPTGRVLSVLPVVGMGGLGKTMLAREVYHHERVSTRFQTRIWVHVSTTFVPALVFKKILATLTSEKVEVENREVLLVKLQRALAEKTFLLVLDDVWNHDRQKWEDLINPLSRVCSTKGNGIIVTTRSSGVGYVVGTLPIYKLKGLSNKGCWSIIKAKAFGEIEIPLEFHIVGKSIAKRCQGLPLAANVVGGLLCGKSKDDWVSIEQNWLSNADGDENNISEILKLSFHHLPSPSLKKCFAYCSFFRKGDWIRRENLIELWMAEGFLQSSQISDMENVGNRYFNLLLQNSLLQVVDRDEYDNVEHCTMHDLVHDVAYSVSNEIYKARDIRRKCIGDASSCIPKKPVKWWYSLSYVGAISDTMFSEFKILHSLILTGYGLEKLSDSIRELIHLRYLDISCKRIEYLPDSIGELYHLQTFRTCDFYWRTSRVKKLPSTIKYLFNLRHLHVSDYSEFPPHLGMLTSLQTLSYYKVRDKEGHRIVELESLKNLKGSLKIDNLEKVQGLEESEKANLIQKSGIIRLVLRWDESREGKINDGDVLKGLQPHPNLRTLEIYGFKGASFPSWTLKMAVRFEGNWVGLDKLTKIRLDSYEECEEIPMMGHLPSLKSLCLCHLRNVKSIGSSFYGIDNCSSNTGVCKETINVFPALERLELWDMPNLREWVELDTHMKVFPCLEYLKIHECKQMTNAPSQFPCLRELDIHVMHNVLPLAHIWGTNLTSLAKLKIAGFYELGYHPLLGPASLKKAIDGILRLGFNSTRELHLVGKADWESLPDQLQHLSALTELYLDGFGIQELPEWIGNLTSLQTLSLRNCTNLRRLPSLEAMRRLTNLTVLYIYDCPLLKERGIRPRSDDDNDDDDSEWPKISHIPNMASKKIERNGIMRHVKSSMNHLMLSSDHMHNIVQLQSLRFIRLEQLKGSWWLH